MLNLFKNQQVFAGNKENKYSRIYQMIRYKPVISSLLQDLTVLTKLYSMELAHIQVIVQLYCKLMDRKLSANLKMAGIGLNMVFKEIHGRNGKSGRLMQALM